jgi:surface polysaccharide O-acyltransferase-like enzyme
VRQLFEGDLLRGTPLLWLAFFMSLLIVYLLSSWLPTLINSSGLTLEAAWSITVMFQVGGPSARSRSGARWTQSTRIMCLGSRMPQRGSSSS